MKSLCFAVGIVLATLPPTLAHTADRAAPIAAASGRAHPTFVSSLPAAGSTVTISPKELRLTFSKSVDHTLSSLTLTGPAGQAVALGTLTQPADSGKVLVGAILAPLGNGPYQVTWKAGGKDGHTMRGHFTFTVAVPRRPNAPPPE